MNSNTLRYISGAGWLVFSGGNDPISDIRASALARAKTYGITAYISLAADGGDALLDDLEDLGARTGYFIDPEFDDPQEIEERLATASLIVIESGDSVDDLYEALHDAARNGIQQAYERGAVILIEGLACNLFGRWMLSDEGDLMEGFNWVQNTFIEPGSAGSEDSRAVQAVLSELEEVIAINIAVGSALVLGSGGHVELWGDPPRVTISLGRKYS